MQIEVRRLSPHDASVPVFQDAWLYPLAVNQGPVHKVQRRPKARDVIYNVKQLMGLWILPGIFLVNGNGFLHIIINFQMDAWVDLVCWATCSGLDVSNNDTCWATHQNKKAEIRNLAALLVPCCWFVCQDMMEWFAILHCIEIVSQKNKTKIFLCSDICEICNPIAPTCLWICLSNVCWWDLWKAIARLSNAAFLEAGTYKFCNILNNTFPKGMHCFNRCCTKDSTHRISKIMPLKAFLSWCCDHCVLVATSLLSAVWVIPEASTNSHVIFQSSRWLYCTSHDWQWYWTPDAWVPKWPHNISPSCTSWMIKSMHVTMPTHKQQEGPIGKTTPHRHGTDSINDAKAKPSSAW